MSRPSATNEAQNGPMSVSEPGGHGVSAAVPVIESHSHWPLWASPAPACVTSAHGLYAFTVRYG